MLGVLQMWEVFLSDWITCAWFCCMCDVHIVYCMTCRIELQCQLVVWIQCAVSTVAETWHHVWKPPMNAGPCHCCPSLPVPSHLHFATQSQYGFRLPKMNKDHLLSCMTDTMGIMKIMHRVYVMMVQMDGARVALTVWLALWHHHTTRK